MTPPTPPPSLRTIVAATDFSSAAGVALARAADLAAACGAHLHVVHGFRWPALADAMLTPAAGLGEQLEAVEAELAATVRPLRERGLRVVAEVAVGPPALVVLAAARQGAELVVLGTRGQAGGVRAVLGGTTRRVLERAPCAVLVVHAADGARALRPARVLAATDFSPGASAALAEASRLLGVGAGEPVTLLHVLPGAGRDVEARCRLAESAGELRRAGLRVDAELSQGVPATEIVAAARERRAELIVVGTRGLSGLAHLLLGSTAELVALRAGCPVLVVPERRPAGAHRRSLTLEPAAASV